MKKVVILRSVSGRAKDYAQRHFRRCTWFDDLASALEALTRGPRPWFVVVDGGRGADGSGARFMSLGYVVETKGVP